MFEYQCVNAMSLPQLSTLLSEQGKLGWRVLIPMVQGYDDSWDVVMERAVPAPNSVWVNPNSVETRTVRQVVNEEVVFTDNTNTPLLNLIRDWTPQ